MKSVSTIYTKVASNTSEILINENAKIVNVKKKEKKSKYIFKLRGKKFRATHNINSKNSRSKTRVCLEDKQQEYISGRYYTDPFLS